MPKNELCEWIGPNDFQRSAKQIRIGISGVQVLLDRINVSGKNDQENFER